MTSKKRRCGWMLAAIALVASALACRPNETVEAQAKDAKLKTQIKSKLASEVDATTLTSIQVNVTNGVVTLAGPAHSAEEKSRIESVARSVPGVTQVNNDLQILGGSAAPAAAAPVTPIAIATPAPTP